MSSDTNPNIDPHTVANFGREWEAFNQTDLDEREGDALFEAYFSLFDFSNTKEGFDLGCGSGRWARRLAPRVGTLHCIDPSAAIDVARVNLAHCPNVTFDRADAAAIPLPDNSQDFGYALGVLHHIPDTQRAMADCVRKLRSGGQFLVYLYYRFDGRPWWFRATWKASDVVRRGISRLPFGAQKGVTGALAAGVYLPLARAARLAEKMGANVSSFPLSYYRNLSFYTMRTDALDRFGTRLEHRFTRPEIKTMMEACGLRNIKFRDDAPYWVAWGEKA